MQGLNKILIVDDNGTNLAVLEEVLAEHYSLKAAKSGEQPLAVAEEFHPDLILLDVMMPGIDGYETLKFKLCKKSGNPYAPEFMLNRFQSQINLPPQFFDVSPSYRDYPEVDEELCIGCGACVDECPVGAIPLEEQKKEVKSHIRPTHCCGCQTCTRYCVRAAIKVA